MTPTGLESTILTLLASGKGILAADESFGTIEKRFAAGGLTSTERSRAAYREPLFSTPGLDKFISGVIIFDETIRQRISDGALLSGVLVKQGIIAGIKVDAGTVELASFAGEKITEGLDGLRERLVEYRKLGARFTKWRAIFAIGNSLPNRACIAANAQALALFAGLSQEAGLVPMVEPEVLMNGDHTLARCEGVTTATLRRVFGALFDRRIALE